MGGADDTGYDVGNGQTSPSSGLFSGFRLPLLDYAKEKVASFCMNMLRPRCSWDSGGRVGLSRRADVGSRRQGKDLPNPQSWGKGVAAAVEPFLA